MARTSSNFTQQEIQDYANWCFKHDVIYDTVSGPDSPAAANAEFVSNYFLNTWQQDMTEKNLDLAFPQLQPHLKFWTPIESENQNLIAKLGSDAATVINDFIDKRRFVRDGQERLETFNCLANYLLRTGHQVTVTNLDSAIGNILNSPQGRFGYLRFDSRSRPTLESERVRLEMEAKAKANTPTQVRISEEEKARAVSHISSNDLNDPHSSVRKISPDSELGRWQKNIHTSQKQETQQSNYEPDYWQGRVRDFLANIPENNIRAELAPQFATPRNASWELTYRVLENTYNRRKTEQWQGRGRF